MQLIKFCDKKFIVCSNVCNCKCKKLTLVSLLPDLNQFNCRSSRSDVFCKRAVTITIKICDGVFFYILLKGFIVSVNM